MSCMIIIRGPLGIGKTTVSKKLANILQAEYVSMDGLLKKHGLDRSDKKLGHIPIENFIKASELILPKIQKKLGKKAIIIFDGCFYHKGHINHLEKSTKFPKFIFTLKAPVETCISRDSRRKKPLGKGAAQAVHNLVSKFDCGKIIDTSGKNAKGTVRHILSSLEADLKKGGANGKK